MTFRTGQNNKIIKGTLENKNNPSNHSKHNDKHEEIRQIQSNIMLPKESKIETKLNGHQINNTNYNVQPCKDDEGSSRNKINDDKDVGENKDNDEDKERKSVKVEAADRDVPDLIDQMERDEDSASDSDNERDDEDKEDQEDNDQTPKESLQTKSGFLSNNNGICGDSNDDRTLKKIRKNAEV